MINKNTNLNISIIGLGYVGLPLALEFAKKRKVIGYDLNKSRIKELNLGIDKNQEFEPKASSKLYPDGRMKSAPLYDLYPFLDSKIIEEIINYE